MKLTVLWKVLRRHLLPNVTQLLSAAETPTLLHIICSHFGLDLRNPVVVIRIHKGSYSLRDSKSSTLPGTYFSIGKRATSHPVQQEISLGLSHACNLAMQCLFS